MTQYANEAWESWLVVSSFVSPAEVFNQAGRVSGFSQNPSIRQNQSTKAEISGVKSTRRGGKAWYPYKSSEISINREYLTNILCRYRYNKGMKDG